MADRPPLTFEIPSSANPTDRWVARCNALARELDEIAATIHPTAWPEALKQLDEKYRKVAGGIGGR